MTTDELSKALWGLADVFGIMRNSKIRYLLKAAANRLEEQDKIIKQYQKADCFLAAQAVSKSRLFSRGAWLGMGGRGMLV